MLCSKLALRHHHRLTTRTRVLFPNSWLSLLLFFLIIAPGLLFDLLSERRRAGLTESVFREISRIVLASLFFSGFAVAVLVVVRTVRPDWMPDPRQLLQHGNYIRNEYRLVTRTLVIEVGLALAASWFAHFLLSRRQGGASIRQISAWTQVFKKDKPPGHDAYVRVRLNGGAVYYGAVANFTSGLDTEGRELVLAPPLYAKANANDEPSPLPSVYQRIVVSGDAIEILSIDYRPSAGPKRPRRGTPRLRVPKAHQLIGRLKSLRSRRRSSEIVPVQQPPASM
jgi:hypothetical protein